MLYYNITLQASGFSADIPFGSGAAIRAAASGLDVEMVDIKTQPGCVFAHQRTERFITDLEYAPALRADKNLALMPAGGMHAGRIGIQAVNPVNKAVHGPEIE
jgi:hypothetical protein